MLRQSLAARFALLAALSACAAAPSPLYGHGAHAKHESLLEVGLTEAEVRARLGPPSGTATDDGGARWDYHYGEPGRPDLWSALLLRFDRGRLASWESRFAE